MRIFVSLALGLAFPAMAETVQNAHHCHVTAWEDSRFTPAPDKPSNDENCVIRYSDSGFDIVWPNPPTVGVDACNRDKAMFGTAGDPALGLPGFKCDANGQLPKGIWSFKITAKNSTPDGQVTYTAVTVDDPYWGVDVPMLEGQQLTLTGQNKDKAASDTLKPDYYTLTDSTGGVVMVWWIN